MASVSVINLSSWTNGSGLEYNLVSTLDPRVDIFIGVYLLVAGTAALLLNGAVLLTIACRLQSSSDAEVYVLHLCAVEVAQVILAFPLVITSFFSHKAHLGINGCQFEAFVVFYCGCASIWTLASLSVYRYAKICHAKFAKHLGRKFVIASLVPINLFSLLWCVSPLLGWGRYAPEPYGLTCSLDWHNLSRSYIFSIFVLCYWVPLTMVVYSYSCMVVAVCKATNMVQTHRTKMDIYLTRMSIAMGITFLGSWTPYAIVSMLYTAGHASKVPVLLTVAAPICAKSNTFLNPIIYYLAVKRFREDALAVICCYKVAGHSDTKIYIQKEHTIETNIHGKISASPSSCKVEISPNTSAEIANTCATVSKEPDEILMVPLIDDVPSESKEEESNGHINTVLMP